MVNFPHLNDTNFPNVDSVDTFKFVNSYDYKRFDNVQMVIRVLNVPWDLGEVHVGNRTVGGIGNVVKFESDAARDAWFASKRYAATPEEFATGTYDGFVWSTQYREFHDEDEIYIPLPFDVAARYNYITVEYIPAPSADYPVDYESERGLLKWFYFSRAVESAAINTTRCVVRRDTWQTYINRVSIPYMVLDRGHAPLAAAASVDTYLQSPVNNNRYLTTPDVDYSNGNSRRVASSSNIILNSEAYYAVIVTTANVAGTWGTQGAATWTTPANPYNVSQGQPSANAFAIRSNRLNAFLNNINSNIPQFIQTIQAVFFVSRELVELGNEFSFGGEACNWLVEKNNRKTLLDLNKAAFRYSAKYANLTKLYTYPYAQIVVSNEQGATSYINVEETSGAIELNYTLSFAWPWLNIEGHLLGVGASLSSSISFANLNSHSFTFGGAWYEHLQLWQIPTFAITQSARDVTTYSTFYDRIQGYLENTTANTNALESNTTANTNALESNTTANTNALESNTNERVNISEQRTLAQRLKTLTNSLTVDSTEENIDKVSDDWDSDYVFNVASTWVSNDVAAISTAINGAQSVLNGAAVGGIAGIGGGAMGVIGGAATGALTSLPASIISAASVPLTITNNNNVSELTRNLGDAKTNHALTNMRNLRDLQTQFNNDSNDAENTAQINIANRNKTLGDAIANRDKATADAIANRDKATADAIANRDKATADAAIVAAFDSASLAAPYQYGNYNGGETSTTRPLGLFASVVTQSIDAIEQTGDYFLKYGYAYKGNWNFETFNVMPKFSYWRCDDLTVRGLDVPDLYMDEIRFFLLGGVTVWKTPEDIGNISIYENV